MNTFVKAVKNQEARTANGMKAFQSTSSAVVDLFFKIGAMRGQNVVPAFTAAYVEDADRALRIALWSRDIRQGAGERQIFKDVMSYLALNNPDAFIALANRVPELGRWDDLLEIAYNNPGTIRNYVFGMVRNALNHGDGLCAKWLPRKGPIAVALRQHFEWTPKFYRKRLVELTKVVETQMCAKDWENINFNHVPSVAASRYKKAFKKHSVKFEEYVKKLAAGDKDVKVNASAIFPYDVLKGTAINDSGTPRLSQIEREHIKAQWAALPNYVGDASILPLVDVSGSMYWSTMTQTSGLRPIDVSVSLGLYLADKNKGPFKDTFLTFSSTPVLIHLNGDILQKTDQMAKSSWGGSTDLHRAIQVILDTAIRGKVPAEDMPKMLLILSDMQFNSCIHHDDTALQMVARKYADAGYVMPQVVFWNLNAADNVPAKMDSTGVALVSGFSPSIVKSVLKADPEKFTPKGIMDATIMTPRYNY